MRKTVLLIPLILFACTNHQQSLPSKKDDIWIVEEKYKGNFRAPDHRQFTISNTRTYELRIIEVGKYTFDKTNVGDTIIYRKK